ncbi:MAG: hypothetical protein GY795_28865 [Desulfobacterales bacterium]|nr:hypothetical protein [Desulfobacterales bacterium]
MKDIISDSFIPFLKKHLADADQTFAYKNPATLKTEFDFSLKNDELNPETLKDIISSLVQFTPNVLSPTYLNYFYSAPDPIGIIGDWLAALLNTNVHAYEASPFFSLAEIELVRALSQVAGYDKDSDGIFCPGGSYSNLLAMYLSRNAALPETISKGLSEQKKLVFFTSEQAHYSFDRAAALLGLGTDAVNKIKCDQKGRIIPEYLKQKIDQALEKGEHPFMVGATLGTTVLGGFDPLTEIQAVLSDYPDIWLHVDAAWGGAVLMSEKFRPLARGIENADSITWDFHKALSAPILCSVLLLKNSSGLKNSFKDDASYLFHGADGNPEHGYNLGEKTPQCGRRADAFKFWLMWKMRGKKHFEAQVEKRFEIAAEVIEQIKSKDCFLLNDDYPDYWNISFWYLPEHLRHLRDMGQCSDNDKTQISRLTVSINQCLKKDGRIMINYATIPGVPTFLRLVVNNSLLDATHLTMILDVVESLGNVLSLSLSELLISGGDDRLRLRKNGSNYINVAPFPQADIVSRSSCSGTHISEENFRSLEGMFNDIRSSKLTFGDCMGNVHAKLRQILDINRKTSIITIPSGSDAEYVPLFMAQAFCDKFGSKQIVNIVSGMGEVGSSTATAAKGLYFRSPTPSGRKVVPGQNLPGLGHIELISVSLRHAKNAFIIQNDNLWKTPLKKALDRPETIVILHVVDSTKLGHRMDVIEDVTVLLRQYSEKLLVVIDSCQSRIEMMRLREYLRIGCMVMLTGSKFEEGPPFSGAVIIPESITEGLTCDHFDGFKKGLNHYITEYDVSGDITPLTRHGLPGWMNWGLMARWTCALINWIQYRDIRETSRNQFVQDWAAEMRVLVKQFPNLKLFSGGELQSVAVGDANTIMSIQMIKNNKPLSLKAAKHVYLWLIENMANRLPKVKLTPKAKEALQMRFLVGQPVDMGEFSIIRIALGAKMVCYINQHGFASVIAQDRKLLLKLSLLVKHFDDFSQ